MKIKVNRIKLAIKLAIMSMRIRPYTFVLLLLIFCVAIVMILLAFTRERYTIEEKLRHYSYVRTTTINVDVKIHNVTEYISFSLRQITDPKRKEKEEKMFKEYLNNRHKIINMLPRLTKQTPTTTFHVLVDNTEKVDVKYSMIVLVSSSAVNFERRRNIRRLWGNTTTSLYKTWRIVFTTGGVDNEEKMKKLYNEAFREKDIIIEDFMESWSLNMGKKVMTGLQWVDANFKYDHILKCDDDVFTDVDAILAKLRTIKQKDLYMGNVNASPVMRKGRYAVPVEEFPGNVFDRFCSGGGYVLSASLVKKLIPLFEWEHPLRIDDAYMGILVRKTGTKPVHMEGFLMWNDKCNYEKNLFLSHPARKECMEKLHKAVVENKRKYLMT